MNDNFFIGDEWPDADDEDGIKELLVKSKEELIIAASKIINQLQDQSGEIATCARCVNLEMNKTKYVKPIRNNPCHRCFEYGEV